MTNLVPNGFWGKLRRFWQKETDNLAENADLFAYIIFFLYFCTRFKCAYYEKRFIHAGVGVRLCMRASSDTLCWRRHLDAAAVRAVQFGLQECEWSKDQQSDHMADSGMRMEHFPRTYLRSSGSESAGLSADRLCHRAGLGVRDGIG